MRLNLVPRERKFFDLFRDQAHNIEAGVSALHDLLVDYQNVVERSKQVREIENHGDLILHDVMRMLSSTFITPMDREDIHALTSALDDVLDLSEEVTDLLALYEIKEIRPELIKMSEVLLDCVREIKILMDKFEKFRDLAPHWIQVNTLENEGDRINRQAISKLFKDNHNPVEIIKWKDLFRLMEAAVDKCEDVANIVENIVIRHA